MPWTDFEKNFELLNAKTADERLGAVSALAAAERDGKIPPCPRNADVNNHIHTWYSFSPYSPAKAVWLSRAAGLATAGIMDHDSISGAEEFRAAGERAGILTTSGTELRVSFAGTEFAGRRINNPDQSGVAYMAFHAVPECRRGELDRFLTPIRAARAARNIAMTERINGLCAPLGLRISYENDVLPLSMAEQGGGVTERHILFALSKALISKAGRGRGLIDILAGELSVEIGEKSRGLLLDAGNEHYEYDLLGVLKSGLVEKFYIDAGDECPGVAEAVGFCGEIGAISAYAYLGDVGDSVTGDKKTQRFEDAYLPELFYALSGLGFRAVTYMPSRNSPAQLRAVRGLCEKHGLLQISGEDINSPRQSFVCAAAGAPEFDNLKDAAYAIIGSERAAKSDPARSMFSKSSIAERPGLAERVEYFKGLAKQGI